MIAYCGHKHSAPLGGAPALEVKGLTAGYPGSDRPALNRVDCSVPVGSVLALVGSNGAGKSTLFKVASGLLPVQEGSVRVFGHPLGVCHHRVVYLPQRSDIDWAFPVTVFDLVLTGRYVYLGWLRRPSAEDRQIAHEALRRMDVEDLAQKQISQLSGGQQQRVLIARALAQDADLLLLDEPLNAVDAKTRLTVAKVLNALKAEGKTVIMATHYYDKSEAFYDGAIYLKDGELVDAGHHLPGHEGCCHP